MNASQARVRTMARVSIKWHATDANAIQVMMARTVGMTLMSVILIPAYTVRMDLRAAHMRRSQTAIHVAAQMVLKVTTVRSTRMSALRARVSTGRPANRVFGNTHARA